MHLRSSGEMHAQALGIGWLIFDATRIVPLLRQERTELLRLYGVSAELCKDT